MKTPKGKVTSQYEHKRLSPKSAVSPVPSFVRCKRLVQPPRPEREGEKKREERREREKEKCMQRD